MTNNPISSAAGKDGVQFVSIEDIFMQSHVIIVLLPFSPELENFISHKYLSMMRNGALIINAARGKLLDEGALLQVIEERNVFAALDVFSSEPLAQFSPLLHAGEYHYNAAYCDPPPLSHTSKPGYTLPGR
ncbi:hypothetical protein HTS61_16940 [Escherichia coli]|nr:hypothetical protein [Escherichia coli]